MFLAAFAGSVAIAAGAEPPPIPVGLDAYRQWEKWPQQRIGARAYMRSTYDRSGRNEGADASHFLYQLADDFNVSLDVEGAGLLCFVRTNHWHGSPWHYVVDGKDHIVQESSTADPTRPRPNSVFLPEAPFPSPLAWTWSTTKGADLMWVPIGFEKSLCLAYSRTRYGTGYYIYQQFVPGVPLSHPIHAWNEEPPPRDVLELIARAGTDIAPQEGVTRAGGTQSLLKDGGTELKTITVDQPSMLRAIQLSAPREQAIEFGKTRLRITWDDRAQPSVDAPLALFFGAGTLYNRDDREHLVKAFPVNIRYDAERVSLACYFPMPFFQRAKIELIGNGARDIRDVAWSLRYQRLEAAPEYAGYFHATYRDHPQPQPGEDLVLLDTRGIEQSAQWSGSFVGTTFIFSHNAALGTLEGDPRFFFDDSESPQAYGTGTEEWGGGGDYWGGLNMTLPFAGHPVGARTPQSAKNDEDKIESAYRFLLGDLFPFGINARIQLEHGGINESTEHYETVTYWYGRPGASLVKTDEMKVGDADSEKAHGYASPEASEPYEIISRYELGPERVTTARNAAGAAPEPANVEEANSARSDRGRKTRGSSEFTLKLEPKNIGALLRRKLDYQFPNQRANVFIADAGENEVKNWQPAGVWSLAGSNTCIYSNPKDELGATEHNVQTSNRRFRQDEFLIPRALTEGRSTIQVRVKFRPVETPLFPGHPLPELAWSEIRYDAYCFVLPGFSHD